MHQTKDGVNGRDVISGGNSLTVHRWLLCVLNRGSSSSLTLAMAETRQPHTDITDA